MDDMKYTRNAMIGICLLPLLIVAAPFMALIIAFGLLIGGPIAIVWPRKKEWYE